MVDGPSRNRGTAATVSTAAAIWQGGAYLKAHSGSASSRPQSADFIFLETYLQETPTSVAAVQQLHYTKKKTDL